MPPTSSRPSSRIPTSRSTRGRLSSATWRRAHERADGIELGRGLCPPSDARRAPEARSSLLSPRAGLRGRSPRSKGKGMMAEAMGCFTDPTVCIGCKACEVACKEWNEVPDDGFTWSGNSYDNTGRLGASTWRHVLFLEQDRPKGQQVVGSLGNGEDPFRWVFLSDV